MAAKKTPTVAIFIGASEEFADAVAETVDITLSASKSAYLGPKQGTPEEWVAHCREVFAESASGEKAVLAEAIRLIATHKENCTVYCDAHALVTNRDAKQYAKVASADAWKNVGSMARAVGASIIWL